MLSITDDKEYPINFVIDKSKSLKENSVSTFHSEMVDTDSNWLTNATCQVH